MSRPKLYFALSEKTPKVWLSVGRQKALNKMANAIHNATFNRISSPMEIAKVALHSLLED